MNKPWADVHKYLPTVSYLDGINVTPSTVKTEDRSALLPKPRLSYCDSDGVRRVVEKFLQEYIQLYDNPETESARKQLIAAYDDNAEFSYSINTLEHHTQSRGDIESYSTYMRSSRNIVFEDRWASNPERVRYKGSMEIVVQLAKLPSTKHLVETFLLDVDFYIDNLCGFTLRGLFIDGAEASSPRPHYKLFMRNFLVVSTGEGTMAILCDTLQICPITEMAADSYRDMLAAAALEANDLPGSSGVNQPSHPNITGNINSSSNSVPSIIVTAAPPPTPQPIDPNIKRQMIEQFASQTGMNLAYSERCLEDNNFDYEASGRRFLEIRSQIPSEAFQQ
uniref:NTF2 domain-containing protein n=1 Tax=Panagrolaimus sp. PS1159 TaxID=55785 RepID=A0AC35EXD8_9BILA